MSEIIEMEQGETAAVPQRQNLPVIAENSPVGMMLAALKQGASLEQVEKMMDLQERWEANEARKAYNDALALFKAEAVEIIKRKLVDFQTAKGRTTYKHAELSDVVEAVGPALSKHGFSWSWTPHQEKGLIRITCTLRHRLGHAESVAMEAPADETGGKNTIQAIVSTTTYLERHTLKAICGLSEKGEDTDGRAPIDTGIVDDWVAAAEGSGSLEELDGIWKDGIKELSKTDSLAVYERFKAAVSKAKKRLEAV